MNALAIMTGAEVRARSDLRKLEVVPRWERVDGVDEIVAWEVWADREPRPHGWIGDLIETFDHECDALDWIERRSGASA